MKVFGNKFAELFVPYEIAISAISKGFSGECIGFYALIHDNTYDFKKLSEPTVYPSVECHKETAYIRKVVIDCVAPTWTDIVLWLLKTHHILLHISPRSWEEINGVHIVKYSFWADVTDIWFNNIDIDDRSADEPYDTYEEALGKAIIGAIKLIDKLPEIRKKYNK